MGWSLLSVGNSTAQQSANATVLYSKTYTISALHLLLDVSYIKGLAPQQAVVRLTKLSDNKEIRGGTLRLNQQQLTIRPFLRGDETVMEAEVTIDANMLAWMYLRGDPKAKLKLEILKKDDAPPPAPEATLTVSPQELRHGEQATLTWSSTHADSVAIEPGIGAVATSGSLEISPSASTTYTLTATGPGGTATVQAAVAVRSGVQPQPRASYGELYEDLIPADAGKAVYDPDRFAMVNGRIFDIQGQPLSGVAVRVLRAEGDYGTAYTDADGNYTLPVEGGGLITLRFTKDGYAEAQRSAMTEWNNWTTFEDAALVRYDEKSTVIAPDGNPAHVFVHQSTVITDEDGTRGVTMGFPGDIKAFRIEDNGTETELPSFTVRATEYTTPESMPAILPPTSAFTWCAEFSLDEALDKPVQFTKPVTVWLDNFLGFEAGTMVPVGFYDRKEGAWIASENGVVVKLVDTNGDGIADGVDATGDNEPEDLNEDGSVTDELTGLTAEQLQGIGNTYWRVEVRHFSPCDFNWSVPAPEAPKSPQDQDKNKPKKDKCKISKGSSVTNRTRELHQDVAIAGTGLTLNYASTRAAPFGYSYRISITGDTISSAFEPDIDVLISVAGRKFAYKLPYEPNRDLCTTPPERLFAEEMALSASDFGLICHRFHHFSLIFIIPSKFWTHQPLKCPSTARLSSN
ncbi:hypothetical protein JCM14635_05710 [Megalodesulfovibrio paquesii]